MHRLSGLDASFLYLETPAQLMHVCAVMVLDPASMPTAYTFDGIQTEIERRVSDVPAFTRKLRRVPLGLDHPIWVEDKQFDIERHVHRLALPAPGGYAELTKLVRAPRRPAAGPVAAAVGDVGDRGLRRRQDRGVHQDAPRDRRRRLRRQPGLPPVRARARRRTARARQRRGPRPLRRLARALRPRAGQQPEPTRHRRQARRTRPASCWRRRSAARVPAPRWPRR